MEKFQRLTDEPALSEATLLIKVEDLIGLTFGDGDTNVINFKMLQHILHILARKMRILEQDVELRFSEEDDILQDLKATYGEPLMGFEDEKAKGKGKGAKGKDAKDKKKGKKVDEGPKEKRVSRGSMTTSDSRSQIGSIEVVTASQFNILNRMVQHLLKRTGGVPLPSMPSNEDLLAELAKGTVSLPEAMEAMQVNARVRAVEHALTMMASLLTQLAASGLLPPAVQAIINQMQSDLQQLALTTGIELEPPTTSKSMLGGGASASKTSIPPEKRNVTTPEMNEALEILKDELNKNLEELTAKSESAAEKAGVLVKSVAEKMEVVLEIDKRLADISSLTTDYDIQMQGFDSGLGLQLQAFREQMISLRTELGNGLQQLEAATANSESNALIELRSSYESLVQDLEQTSANHGALLILQKQLSDELKRLVESVELLREEKADRDEVADGLRDKVSSLFTQITFLLDCGISHVRASQLLFAALEALDALKSLPKANISRLKGLLRQPQFDESYKELQYRLNLSYEKFHRQEDVWMTALDDLKDIVMTKASYDELVNLKEFAVKTLNEFFEYLRRLEILLGEPKTAMLTHKLSRTGYCGPCQVGALMEPTDVRSSAPPKLPPLRKEGGGEPFKTICTVREDAEAAGKHACKRWVGGSHTLISEHTTREHATPALGTDIPTRQYIGLGNDGRFYHMEEDLEPCLECNKITPSETEEDLPPPEEGGGDIA